MTSPSPGSPATASSATHMHTLRTRITSLIAAALTLTISCGALSAQGNAAPIIDMGGETAAAPPPGCLKDDTLTDG
jgi:hypothetical protein